MNSVQQLQIMVRNADAAMNGLHGGIMSKNKNRFPLKFPEGMREQIKAHAQANLRSMNAEIIFRLESVEALQLEVSRLHQALNLLSQPLMESAHV